MRIPGFVGSALADAVGRCSLNTCQPRDRAFVRVRQGGPYERHFQIRRVGVLTHHFRFRASGDIRPAVSGQTVGEYAHPTFKICRTTSMLFFAIGLVVSLGGCADLQSDVSPPPTAATTPTTQPADPAWPGIAKALERPGVLKDGIYTITVPRDDLDVTIDGMGIPTGAGIESIFYFYRCPCGKMNVAGQFVTADYESNDVVDALRKNAAMNVASIAPLLLYAKPNLTVIRFQAEGDPVVMAGILREALRWTGKERMAPEPLPKTP